MCYSHAEPAASLMSTNLRLDAISRGEMKRRRLRWALASGEVGIDRPRVASSADGSVTPTRRRLQAPISPTLCLPYPLGKPTYSLPVRCEWYFNCGARARRLSVRRRRMVDPSRDFGPQVVSRT